MANWLTISDFYDDIQLSASTITAVNTEFDKFIGRMQVEFLRKVLGAKMYNDLMTGLAVLPTPDAKWTNIRDGLDFVYDDGITYHLDGLKEALRYYSYVRYQQIHSSTNTVQNNVVKKSDIATVVEPVMKVVNAQNKCMDLSSDLYDYITWKSTDYPDFEYTAPFISRANMFGI